VFLNLYLLLKESRKQISFTNTKEKMAERIQDVHENNILNVNVVNTLEMTHKPDSQQYKQNTPFNTREWLGLAEDVGF